MGKLLLYCAFLLVTLLFLLLIKQFNIAYPLTITNRTADELAVTGTGKADVVPDQGAVTASIEVNGVSSQQDTQNQMNKINDAILSAVQQLGIAKRDVQTTQYQINPNYDYASGGQKSNGFNGTASVTITVRDFSKVSQVLNAITAAGATNVNSSNGTISDPEKYQVIARQRAIDDAKTQAKKLADTLGIRLGKVVNFVENPQSQPGPIMYDKAMSLPNAAGGAPTTIEPGTQTVTSTVTLYFERD